METFLFDKLEILELTKKGKDYWSRWINSYPQEKIDLSGINFCSSEYSAIDLSYFRFGDNVSFEGSIFPTGFDFEGAVFGRAYIFAGVQFLGRTSFKNCRFGDSGDFSEAEFQGEVSFEGASFGKSIDFSRSTFFGSANLTGSKYLQELNFDSAEFKNDASFEDCKIGFMSSFRDSKFSGHASFKSSEFASNIVFKSAVFCLGADFSGTAFGAAFDFSDASFRQGASFARAQFGDAGKFDRAYFLQDADYGRAVVGSGVSFKDSRFFGSASFHGAELRERVSFENCSFDGTADFEAVRTDGSVQRGATFFTIDFARADFAATASFCNRDFQGAVNFSGSRFGEPPDFRSTMHRENLDWTGVRFTLGGRSRLFARLLKFSGWTTNSETVTRLRRLRGIAKEIHSVDAERDLFILERKAERGVLWHEWWRRGWRSWLTGIGRPLVSTVLMFLYTVLSDCGRSVSLPLFWIGVINYLFFRLYAIVYTFLYGGPLLLSIREAIRDFTFANAFPFGGVARPTLAASIEELFRRGGASAIEIAWQFQLLSVVQATVNVILVFLFGLALRNYFKVN